ncbi:NAD-dependent epimerase/dehydratase family protein [Thermomonospora cellulosilytica]|uniref:Nucleoside-diphosphate-sugar epimerase n=1 Tax=Thermomonospora cellulosilytica TaxID=1411118 RepID=A0A7W3N2W9_9ACTN|nr:NAD(P)-dependent oxidoreductase [Thermomonospora cellulosilytica]MBA9006545.1 nucleoside-diphosphate-sugar epimerase [Thermomonospora cellulosilytica]
MRVLVTGARGKVGRSTVGALLAAGHEVVGTDLGVPRYELPDEDGAAYVQADLRDPGDVYAVVRGCQAIVHCAAIPTHARNTPHHVFANNLLSTYHLAEAAEALGVRRIVNLSSAAVAGHATAVRPSLPEYLPADEAETVRPQEPYALAKHVGEQIMDMTARRSDVACVSLRPSWVQRACDYEANLGPLVRDPQPRLSRWSYVDMGDLVAAIALAVDCDLPGHEVFHIAAEDNTTGRPLHELVERFYGDRVAVRPTGRPDASAVSCEKARRLLGFHAKRSWRDHLGEDGRALTAVS